MFASDCFHSWPGGDHRAGPSNLRQTESSDSRGRGGGQTHHQEGHQAHHAHPPHPPLHRGRGDDSHPLRLLLRHKAASGSAGHGGEDGGRLVEYDGGQLFLIFNIYTADNVTDQHREETSQAPEEIN